MKKEQIEGEERGDEKRDALGDGNVRGRKDGKKKREGG
jgi:hypothetical protein